MQKGGSGCHDDGISCHLPESCKKLLPEVLTRECGRSLPEFLFSDAKPFEPDQHVLLGLRPKVGLPGQCIPGRFFDAPTNEFPQFCVFAGIGEAERM